MLGSCRAHALHTPPRTVAQDAWRAVASDSGAALRLGPARETLLGWEDCRTWQCRCCYPLRMAGWLANNCRAQAGGTGLACLAPCSFRNVVNWEVWFFVCADRLVRSIDLSPLPDLPPPHPVTHSYWTDSHPLPPSLPPTHDIHSLSNPGKVPQEKN